jgi:hypothetical protein
MKEVGLFLLMEKSIHGNLRFIYQTQPLKDYFFILFYKRHALGFTTSPPNEFTETIFIKGTAHCADMYPSSDKDPEQLTEARNQIRALIRNWLKQ